MPCLVSKPLPGRCILTTWAGAVAGHEPLENCQVDDSSKVLHCVKVKNLKSYEADVLIEGEIAEKVIYKVRFSGAGVDATGTSWAWKVERLGNLEERVISHVAIEKHQIGTETIHTRAGFTWVLKGQMEPAPPLRFSVTVT